MADGIELDVIGADGILAVIEDMSQIGDSKEFRDALLEAAELIDRNVQEELQKLVYDLPENPWKQRTERLKRETGPVGKVTKSKGALVTGVVSRPFYARFLEYGTENKDGSTRIKARPFMRRGLDKSREAVIQMIADKLFKRGG